MPRLHAFLVLVLAILPAGCVERSLSIRSDPAGAAVLLNGRRLAQRTPVTVPISHHGAMRVEAEKDGFLRKIQVVKTDEPWYDVFPFDLFAELVPWTLASETEVNLRLEKVSLEAVSGEDLDRLHEEGESERERLTQDD